MLSGSDHRVERAKQADLQVKGGSRALFKIPGDVRTLEPASYPAPRTSPAHGEGAEWWRQHRNDCQCFWYLKAGLRSCEAWRCVCNAPGPSGITESGRPARDAAALPASGAVRGEGTRRADEDRGVMTQSRTYR